MTTAWPEFALGEVAAIERVTVTASAIESGTTYVGLEHITSTGLFQGHGCVEPGELLSNKFRFTSDHVLYGKLRPNLSKIAAPSFGGVCSTDILPIRPRDGLDKRFLLHFLRQPAQVSKAASLASGANLPRLSPKVLAEVPIPMPPIEEQRRIAALLDQADELRAKRQTSLALLESFSESLFIDMFGGERGLLRPLLEILEKAEVFVDGDWVESKDQDPEGDVRLIQLADVGDGYYVNKSNRFMTSEKAAALKCTYLRPDDILIARMPDPLGRACLFPGDARQCVTVVDVCVVRPGPAGPDPRWLCQALNSPHVRKQIEQFTTGTTRMRISRGNLGRVELPVPPLAAQHEFTARTARVAALRSHQAAALAAQDQMFLCLQHRAFAGQL